MVDFNPALAMQVGSMGGIFVVCLVGGLIPIRLTKLFKDQATVLSVSNCLGAGVLLGASYVHLMTDAEAKEEGEEDRSIYVSDRLNHFLVAIGFLASFILEKVLFELPHEHPGGGHGHGHGHGHGNEHVITIDTYEDDDEEGQEKTEMTVVHKKKNKKKKKKGETVEEGEAVKEEEKESLVHNAEGGLVEGEEEGGRDVEEEGIPPPSPPTKVHKRKNTADKQHHHKHVEQHDGHIHVHEHDEEHGEEEVEVSIQETVDGHETVLLRHKQAPEEGEEHHDHIIEHRHPRKRKIPYMLFFVLGLESAVSGCALGFQTTLLDVLILFVAIASHIWAEAFTLCASLLKAKVADATALKAMIGFSFITPAATLVGLALAHFLQKMWVSILSSVLISLAAGTFIFVANMEIMAEEFSTPHNRWTKLSFLLVGFTFMAALGFVF